MQIYAHRGSSGTHPENTLASFRESAQLAVYGVEFDVHMTKDGQLVVIHDERIDRTSNGTGFIKDMTFEELRQFDYGSWFSPDFRGEGIPTLEEVLEVFSTTDHKLNIELKSDVFPYAGMVEKVISLVTSLELQSRVILSSFDHEAIRLVKKLTPEIETGALFMESLVSPLDYLTSIPADALHLFMPAAIRSGARNAMDNGIAVRAFTVNEEMYADLLQASGVSAIFTDYPQKMLEYLTSHE
jgi:glycerophosphoryl diester phosphodiesterase